MPLSNLDDLPTYLMKWYGVTDLGFAPEKLSTANHRSSADVTGGHIIINVDRLRGSVELISNPSVN